MLQPLGGTLTVAFMDISGADLVVLHNALNEVLHGPDAIEEWEFQIRLGLDRDEAVLLLARLSGALST
ncbi:hypothetical protein GCM10023225_15830 [Kineococcus glutinatus]|uniref:Uncharacterized protein n=2 Tax=Kineococcus glutinatus TaxID=1070872 RepID=A0ABP9HPR8_9ACTN